MSDNNFDPFDLNGDPAGAGNGGAGPEPVTNVMPPIDPIGKSSQTYGLLGLILTLTCCAIAGLVLGIMAVVRASASHRMIGFDTAPAATGRMLGILSIVFSAIRIVGSIAWVVIMVLAFLAGLDASSGTVVI